jgi:hypothetical protein
MMDSFIKYHVTVMKGSWCHSLGCDATLGSNRRWTDVHRLRSALQTLTQYSNEGSVEPRQCYHDATTLGRVFLSGSKESAIKCDVSEFKPKYGI